jgi:hypothetical protein
MDQNKTIGRGTYSPDDNKLRLYSEGKLSDEDVHRLKVNGFRWAPGQKLWVAPAWTPPREDLLLDLCGEIQDEDTSLVERAEQRAQAFETFAEHREADAARASGTADRIAGMIPLGQPILVGHHSEGRARRDQERIHNNTRKAIKFWDQAKYWKHRATAAVRHARYKADPQVRARRIKELEKQERAHKSSIRTFNMHMQSFDVLNDQQRLERYLVLCAGLIGSFPTMEGDKPPHSEGPDLYDLLDPNSHAREQGWYVPRDFEKDIKPHVLRVLASQKAKAERWLEHYQGRLGYERAMLEASGRLPADNGLEPGGAVKCSSSPSGGFNKILKVNKSTVSIADNFHGRIGRRNLCKTKITTVLTKTQVDELRAANKIVEDQCTITLVPTPKA